VPVRYRRGGTAGTRQSARSTATTTGRVKPRYPNPAKFAGDDKEKHTFREWFTDLQAKLEEDADYFEEIGVAGTIRYICTRVTGHAFNVLEPQNPATCPPGNEFKTVEEVFQVLKDNFADKYRMKTAITELRDLKMKDNESFRDFYNKYNRLACQIPSQPDELKIDDFKTKLKRRLYFEVQRHAYRIKTFKDLVEVCEEVDEVLREGDKLHPRNNKSEGGKLSAPSGKASSNNGNRQAVRGSSGKSNSSPGPFPDKYRNLPPLTDAIRAQLDLEKKCYACREKGHHSLSDDCPLKPWSRSKGRKSNLSNHNTTASELPAREVPATELQAEDSEN
jgi:hypothetical protein